MLGTRHSLLFLTALMALLVLSPKVGSAQANEAPVFHPAQTWSPSDSYTVGNGSGVFSSTTPPVMNPWLNPYWQMPTGTAGNVTGWGNPNPTCVGVACLTDVEKTELTALCKHAGTEWEKYGLCKTIGDWIVVSQP